MDDLLLFTEDIVSDDRFEKAIVEYFLKMGNESLCPDSHSDLERIVDEMKTARKRLK